METLRRERVDLLGVCARVCGFMGFGLRVIPGASGTKEPGLRTPACQRRPMNFALHEEENSNTTKQRFLRCLQSLRLKTVTKHCTKQHCLRRNNLIIFVLVRRGSGVNMLLVRAHLSARSMF